MFKEIATILVCLTITAHSVPVGLFYPNQYPNQNDGDVQIGTPEQDLKFKNELKMILENILNEQEVSNPVAYPQGIPSGSDFQRRQHWSQGFFPGGK